MSNLLNYTNPQVEIGEYIQVFVGPDKTPSATLGSGQYLLPGTYNQSDYPELFNRIGFQEGAAYTPRISGTTSAITSLAYGNGVYLYGTLGGGLSSSTDGITWTTRTNPSGVSNVNALIYANGLYVYGGDGGVLGTSTNGTSFTSRTSGTSSVIQALTYGNGLYVYAGSQGALATSTNATTWTARTAASTSFIVALTYGNGLYVYVGNGGALGTSTDGTTWIGRVSNTTSSIWAITYGNGLYVYGGVGGVLATSTDAITWTARTSGTTSSIAALIYANGLYIYATSQGGSGIVATSSDAITWTTRSIGSITAAHQLFALAYGNGFYLLGGWTTSVTPNSGLLYTSTTGVTIEYSTTYNLSTQFVVPSVAIPGAITGTALTGYSIPQNIYYIRAK